MPNDIYNPALPSGANTIGAVNINSNAAKVTASFTRPANTDAYTAGDVVATATANLTFANVLAAAGAQGIILAATLEIDIAAIPSGMSGFKLHIYDALPTVIADNAAYNLPSGDRAKYLGYIQLASPVDNGDTCWSQNDGLTFNFKLASGSTSLYAILATDGAYTPTSEAVYKITLFTAGY